LPKRAPARCGKVAARLRQVELRCRAMEEVARALTAVEDLDLLLELVAEKVTALLEADRTSIYLLDVESGQLWSRVVQGDEVSEIRLRPGEGVAGWVAQSGRKLNLKDAYQDERFNPQIDRLSGYRTRSLLSAPLLGNQGQVLGVVQALNKKDGSHFTPEDEQLLDAICSQVAVAVENTQLVLKLLGRNLELQEARLALARKVEELDVLFQLEREVAEALDIDQMMERLLRRTAELLGCEAGSIATVEKENLQLVFCGAIGSRAEQVRRLRLPRGSGVAGWVVQQGRVALVNRPHEDPRFSQEVERLLDYKVNNLLAVPLEAGGEVIGVLELLNKQRGDFTADDEKLATLIAGQAHSALIAWSQRVEREKENRLQAIGQMLSGVIHDFRTPLTIVSGYVQLMALENDAQKRGGQAELVLRQIDFINNMTRELLAFARGESGLLLHRVHTDRFLADLKEVLERELGQSGVRLEICDRYQGVLRADENKLQRLVINLARNARQAMPGGGVFTIRVDDAGERVRFEFIDNGPGLSENVRRRLFESFVTEGKKDGTGLGLAIVKKIVDEHGGGIEVESFSGRGTTFRVEFPKRID